MTGVADEAAERRRREQDRRARRGQSQRLGSIAARRSLPRPMALTDPSKRLEAIPPYMFAELERKVAAKRAAGIDVISLGIGDPDTPTYPHIVEAMQAAVADPGTHQYPSNRGRAEFREAFARFYDRALRGRDRSRDRGDPGDRRQGVHLQPLLRLPRPGRRRARLRSRLSGLHRRAAARRRRGRAAAAASPSSASPPTSTRSPADDLRARAADLPQLPEQPDRRGRPRRALRARGRARPRARDPRRPRQRLLGDDLRRLRRPELPRHARAPRRSGSRSSRSPRAST